MKGGERQPRCPKRDVSSGCTHKFAMSALPPKADIVQHGGNVRFVPFSDQVQRSKTRPLSITSSASIGRVVEINVLPHHVRRLPTTAL
jgi:hypothetical protein